DAFATKLNASGSSLIESTYFGGSGDDLGLAIQFDPLGGMYLFGGTGSSNLQTTPSALDSTFDAGGQDAFLARFAAPLVVTTTAESGPGSLRQAILDANAGLGTDTIQFSIGSGVQTIRPGSFLRFPNITGPVSI